MDVVHEEGCSLRSMNTEILDILVEKHEEQSCSRREQIQCICRNIHEEELSEPAADYTMLSKADSFAA